MEANVDKRTLERQHALAYADNVIATLREPFLVLDKSLRVRMANAAFYRDFPASKVKEATEGRFGESVPSVAFSITPTVG